MKIGDWVSVIDDQLEGKVVSIDENMISFESDDGFRYTYPRKKIVVIKSSIHNFLKNRNVHKKDKIKKTKKKISHSDKPVFDLHIEKIQSKHHHLSDNQKLEIQLQEIRRIFHKMQYKHYREFIMIHGIGKGILRSKIIQLVKEKNWDYSDASYQLYGGGALLIIKNNSN